MLTFWYCILGKWYVIQTMRYLYLEGSDTVCYLPDTSVAVNVQTYCCCAFQRPPNDLTIYLVHHRHILAAHTVSVHNANFLISRPNLWFDHSVYFCLEETFGHSGPAIGICGIKLNQQTKMSF